MRHFHLTKAHFNIFLIYIFFICNVYSLILTVGWFFPVRMSISMLIIIWSDLTLKVSNNSKVTISAQLDLITLTIYKLHKHYIVYCKPA